MKKSPDPLAVTAFRIATQYSSRTRENVLDRFGGSGSTFISADQTGRKAFLMEMDSPYCDVIVQRWSEITGRKAERVMSRIGLKKSAA